MFRLARLVPLTLLLPLSFACGTPAEPGAVPATTADAAALDRDLVDVTVANLHRLYDDQRYSVTTVVQWHLARIDRYNGVYGAIETLYRDDALAAAARLDRAAAADGGRQARAPRRRDDRPAAAGHGSGRRA